MWVHAARALGRLTGPVEQLQGTLLDWVLGESRVLRQRALTAFASLPAERFALVAGQLSAIIRSKDEDPWVLAAIAAATPYLFFERRDLWDRLANRILAGDGGAISARALSRGLATLFRRGGAPAEVERPLRTLREMARHARPQSLDDTRRWLEVIAVTDPIDGAERDPLDLEIGIENLARIAAQYDDEEADARAARAAAALAPTFHEARKIALGAGRLRQRAAAINALEGAARAFALRLWAPLLATRPGGEPTPEPDLTEPWTIIARAPAEILDLVKERRQSEGGGHPETNLSLEVLAIRLGGYALDACGEDEDLGPGRGPTAHETCLWLRKIDGLADGSRELPPALSSALSTLFWRLVDTTRGTALGEVDDVQWLGPFAAWWGLVIDRPALLLQLAQALPMMSEMALAECCDRAEMLRTAVSSSTNDGDWGPAAAEALAALHATDTELAHALEGLARALGDFSSADGKKAELEAQCLELVLAGDRLHGALADPVKALHPASASSAADSLSRAATENAPRVSMLLARAIRARELSLLDVWFASLGPVTSALLEVAVRGAIRRTPPPIPKPKKKDPELIEGYELIKPLGEGGIGSVWLVRKPGAERFFVLKIPKAEALASATEVERAGILASFIEEAKALAGLYHPNVANIIDHGMSSGAPYLVLEYLIGADLKQYSGAHLMSLYELRQVVLETCAGLAALHHAGLVHRDIKPANLWLRLPLAGGERFDPQKHRNPAIAHPLATVVIDFGMVRAIRVPPEVGGRFVAGTAGYIAPEQVLDPVELDPRSDVYALAGTIYNVTTGRSFFDEIDNARDRIIAHMRRDPFENPERLRGWPAAMAALLRAATAQQPKDRPGAAGVWPRLRRRALDDRPRSSSADPGPGFQRKGAKTQRRKKAGEMSLVSCARARPLDLARRLPARRGPAGRAPRRHRRSGRASLLHAGRASRRATTSDARPGPQAPRRRGHRERGLRALPRRHRPRMARLLPPAEPPRSRLPAGPRRRAHALLPQLPRPRGRPAEGPTCRRRRPRRRLCHLPRHRARRRPRRRAPRRARRSRAPTSTSPAAPIQRLRPHRRLRRLPRVPLPHARRRRRPLLHADHRARAPALPRVGEGLCRLPHAPASWPSLPRLQRGPRRGLPPREPRRHRRASARRHAPFHAHPDAPRTRLPHGRSLPPPRGRLRAPRRERQGRAPRAPPPRAPFRARPRPPRPPAHARRSCAGRARRRRARIADTKRNAHDRPHFLVGELPARGHRRRGEEPGRGDRRVRGEALHRPAPMEPRTPSRERTMNLSPSHRSFVALCLLGATAMACSKAPPTPEKETVSPPSAAPLTSAAPSASAASIERAPAKKALPTLAPEPFAPAKGMGFYSIEGALVVVEGLRVGRIVDEAIAWFGTLPETNAWLGGSQINGVYGTFPDAVDVFYSSNNGRAAQPSLYPLTGKGTSVTFSPGGGIGWVSGTARLGKTTIVGGYGMSDGYTLRTVRGPGLLLRPTLADKVGCTDEELQRQWGGRDTAVAVAFRAVAATEKGTLVTIGNLCDRDDKPVAEVWDEPGKSRIIELSTLTKNIGYFPRILVGKGDDLWLDSTPVLHYSAGKFEPLPKLDRPLKSLFVSPAGKLHGISGRTIHRFDEGKWTAIANLPWPMWFSTIAMDEKGTLWVAHDSGVARLREQSGPDIEGDCKTPFVYLYEVSWKNEPKFTFPTTRKALSTFPQVADITLVEYWEGSRSLGVQVKSKEQGEAVAAHVVANMKDEHPEVICYAPKKPRVIEMKAGK